MMDMSPKYNGEPTAESLASGMATLGRYGDSYMVHAAEGETVVPREILDSNPGLKQDLFRQMQMMGIKDPNRYVIGNSLNSINPVTGQPEFFFKKIWKAIKKIWKPVAAIAAPIIGNMIMPGIGGILASMLVSKISGGSWGDALKAGALSYGASALGSGIMGTHAGQSIFGGATSSVGPGGLEGFMSGAGKGLTAPFQAVGGMFSGDPGANPLSQGIFGSGPSRSGMDALFPSYDPTGAAGRAVPSDPSGYFGEKGMQNIAKHQAAVKGTYGWPKQGDPSMSMLDVDRDRRLLASVKELAPAATKAAAGAAPTLMEKAMGHVASAAIPAAVAFALTPEEEAVGEGHAPGSPERRAYDQWTALEDKTTPEARQLKLQWYGPAQRTTAELVAKYQSGPSRMMDPKTFASNVVSSPTTTGRSGPLSPLPAGLAIDDRNLQGAPKLMVAGGGTINGPGTGRSDSIPAMLSDGEFVMTAEAVRNAGAGSRDRGAARMYDMMSRLERMA